VSARQTAKLVVLETMPDCWRESHRASGNFGFYPSNGAERRIVSREEAEEICRADEDAYDHIVRDLHGEVQS
jgi:hypothetical protein